MKKALIGAASVLAAVLCGCDTQEPIVTDQCLRTELFRQCLAAIPKGPDRVGAAANDWQEVVEECGSQSKYQSLRKKAYVKPECAL